MYKISSTGGNIVILHNFANGVNNGVGPNSLAMDQNGNLYGTTIGGGGNNAGILYSFINNTLNVLYNLTPIGFSNSGPGYIFSITNNTIYFTDLNNGSGSSSKSILTIPISGGTATLINSNGGIYAFLNANNIYTNYYNNFAGTSFEDLLNKITIGNPNYTLLYDNTTPPTLLPSFLRNFIVINGFIYGISELGGKYNKGTLYKLSTNGGTIQTLYDFNNNTPVYLNNNSTINTFYISTSNSKNGSVVQINNNNGVYTENILYNF